MNQRLEGWRLALAILVPVAIVAAAIWIALQAFGGDDGQTVDTADDTSAVQPTSTPVAQTAQIAEPTVAPTPTALALPAPPSAPTATEVPTAAPTATSVPASGGSSGGSSGGGGSGGGSSGGGASGGGATPTPTVDASIVTITCATSGGSFPSSVDVGDTLPELSAAVSPPSAAATLSYRWNFGNNFTIGAPNTGSSVSYDAKGSYNVVLTATDSINGEVTTVACGTVTVGEASTATSGVACIVRPVAASVKWADATANDLMRVTTTWKPTSVSLELQYEFGVRDPLIFSNPATTPDMLTRTFLTTSDIVRVFWRNPETGETGRISCRAFPEPAGGYNGAST